MGVEYRVVNAPGDDSMEEPAEMLREEVQIAIADGWRPIGGVAVAHGTRKDGSSYFHLFQAMMRRVAAPPDELSTEPFTIAFVDPDGTVVSTMEVPI
jgi:hypothetical protein